MLKGQFWRFCDIQRFSQRSLTSRLRGANLQPISAIMSSSRWCLIDMVFEKRTGSTGVCGRQRNPGGPLFLIVDLKWRHIHSLSGFGKRNFFFHYLWTRRDHTADFMKTDDVKTSVGWQFWRKQNCFIEKSACFDHAVSRENSVHTWVPERLLSEPLEDPSDKFSS